MNVLTALVDQYLEDHAAAGDEHAQEQLTAYKAHVPPPLDMYGFLYAYLQARAAVGDTHAQEYLNDRANNTYSDAYLQARAAVGDKHAQSILRRIELYKMDLDDI